MSNIGQRVFVLGGNQLYMTLANEEYVRALSIGSTWTKLRLGLMCAITPDGTNNLLNMNCTMGVCSGAANPFGAASTTNWVGAWLNGAPAGNMTYTANAGSPYYADAALAQSGKKVGATVTASAAGGVFNICTNTGSTQRRSIVYVDITKGSPNYTIQSYTVPTANQTVDWSFSQFLDGMEQVGATVNAIAFSSLTSNTVATSEVAGVLDTFDLYWSKAVFSLEVYAIAVFRSQ